jgi:hypothetical protein
VYSKTATMLYNLQYVLGDTLFQNAMKHYFNQWKMAHPYPNDFRNSIIDYTKTDLNWFFDQWIETTKNIDYKVCSKRISYKCPSSKSCGGDVKCSVYLKNAIVIKRIGEMQMPIDMDVVTENNDTLHYYIPNTWFEKKTNAKTLPRWIGWQKVQPTYIAKVDVPGKVKDVIIDPTYRLADINMMNNAKRAKVQMHWDAQVFHTPDWRRYHIYTRPELWWNAVDGLKVGWHFNGNYMQYRHQFAFSFWIPTGLGQGSFSNYELSGISKNDFDKFNYRLSYSTGLDKVIKGLSGFYTSGYVEGLEFYRTGFVQKIKSFTISTYIKLLTRSFHERTHYVLNDVWGSELNNYSLNIVTSHRYNYEKGTGKTIINIRMPFVAADYSYSYVEAEKLNYTRLWRFELRTRVYGRFGFDFNDKGIYPWESMLSLSGANNEELMDYALLRSKGYVPPATLSGTGTLAFQQGGGLNLRGYTNFPNLSKSGAAVNVEFDFDEIVKIKPKKIRDYIKLDTYLFFDGGVTNNKLNSRFIADAGVGIALTIKKFGALEKIKPFTLRFDMPFWVSDGSLIGQKDIANRWVFGLYRSF